MALIRADNLSLKYGHLPVIYDVSLEINAGEIVTLIGPNGAGKSSLVRMMIGVLKPDSGQIEHAPDLRIGYVPQKLDTTNSIPMSVARFLGKTGRSEKSKRAKIIEKYGIESLLKLPLASLSGGEMRRVLFAYALMDEPNLLILDEPTAGLDIAATARFYEFTQELRDHSNMAILLVSHDLNVVMKASDRVICLNGHICCQGEPKDVSAAPEYAKMMGIYEPVAIYEHHHDHQHEH